MLPEAATGSGAVDVVAAGESALTSSRWPASLPRRRRRRAIAVATAITRATSPPMVSATLMQASDSQLRHAHPPPVL